MKISTKTLYKKLPEIKVFNGFVNLTLAKAMFNFMLKGGGIGLAANQIGREMRVFVMGVGKLKACFNPVVLKSSIITKTENEGCLSFKGVFIPIDRSTEIDVQYQTWDGQVIKETLKDLEARCFLHELDHLDGITMQKRKKLNESVGTVKKEFDGEGIGSLEQIKILHREGYGSDQYTHAERSIIGNT